jgi:hypothetical protein
VLATISLRRAIVILALFGIVAKVGLFGWMSDPHSQWTTGSLTLAGFTIVLGLLVMVLALFDLGRSGGHWVPVTAFILGLLIAAPFIGAAV